MGELGHAHLNGSICDPEYGTILLNIEPYSSWFSLENHGNGIIRVNKHKYVRIYGINPLCCLFSSSGGG